MKLNARLRALLSDERVQIAYGIAVLLLVPAVIVFNVMAVVGRSGTAIDVALQRQALLVGRTVAATFSDTDPQRLAQTLAAIREASSDVEAAWVLGPSDNREFTVVSSADTADLGQRYAHPLLTLAWGHPDGEALAVDSLPLTPLDTNERVRPPTNRFWLVVLPVSSLNALGVSERSALLVLRLSADVVDDLATANWTSAVFWLTVTVLLVVLFLAASTRLWGYASLYRKIREVDRMKDEFISIASHELRTPITAIKGYVSMVQDGSYGPVNARIREGLGKVGQSSDRLGQLVEDLLDVSRIDQGRLQLKISQVIPSVAAQATVLELTPMAKAKGLTLDVAYNGEIPMALADPDKLHQVLVNLVGNAIKYTEVGAVELRVMADGSWVVFRVKDTGIGMSAEAQAHLFEKFYRIQSDQTAKIRGSGLGLWITKQLVELMRGQIEVQSIEGTGTQVIVRLPAAPKP